MSMSSIHVFDGGVIPDSESSGGSSGSANIKNLIMRDFDLNLEGETVSSKILCDYNSPQESVPYYAPVSIEDMAQWTKDGFNIQVRLESQPSVAANLGFLARVSITHNSTEDEVTDAKVITYERLDDHRIKFNILNFGKVTDEVTSIDYLKLSGMDEFTLDSSIDMTVEEILAKIPSTATASNKLVTEQQLENATASMASGYTPKGPASVSTLNGMSGHENGDQYIVTDSGTLTDGSLAVTAGESVAWDSVNEVWYKVNQYALKSVQDNIVNALEVYGYTNKYAVSELSSTGVVKNFNISFHIGDKILHDLTVTGTANVKIYLVKTDNSYVDITNKHEYTIAEDGFSILRVYTVSADGSYDIDFSFTIYNENIAAIKNELDVKALYDYPNHFEQQNIDVNGWFHEFNIPFHKGDLVIHNLTVTGTANVKVYLVKTLSPLVATDITNLKDYTIDEDGFTMIRLYTVSRDGSYSVEFDYTLLNANMSDLKNEISEVDDKLDAYKSLVTSYNYPNHFERQNIDVNGWYHEFNIPFHKGDRIIHALDVTGTANVKVYLVKTLSPLVATDITNRKDYTIDEDGFTMIRLYAVSHDGSYDVDFDYTLLCKNLSDIKTSVDAQSVKESDLQMCLPDKVFAVRGLPYNVYASSVMLDDFKNVDIFTQPRTTTNFKADLLQIGKVCKLDNLEGCSLRIGFEDYLKRNTGLVYKDLDVVYNKLETPVTKEVIVIGDSITNRGSGHFAKKAAEEVGSVINGHGTMSNYSSFRGEGREGWTFADFIGKSNACAAGTITPMGSGTSGSLTTNPFIRVATDEDLENYPDFCFSNTGANSEQSYSDDATLGTYYIFDFAYYLERFADLPSIDAVTVALGTNDILQGYSTADIIAYATFMLQRIKSALPSARIALIPSPAWGATYGNFSAKVVPYIEAAKTMAETLNVDIVGLWCFLSRFHSFGLKTSEAETINASTEYAPYNENVHFDTGDGSKYAYIEYGKVLAAYILQD